MLNGNFLIRGFGFVFFLDKSVSILVDIFEFCCLVNLFFYLGFLGLQNEERFLKEFIVWKIQGLFFRSLFSFYEF